MAGETIASPTPTAKTSPITSTSATSVSVHLPINTSCTGRECSALNELWFTTYQGWNNCLDIIEAILQTSKDLQAALPRIDDLHIAVKAKMLEHYRNELGLIDPLAE